MSAVTSSPSVPSARRGTSPAFSRPSFATLTRVELRKAVDTRSGRILVGITVLLAVVILGFLVLRADAAGLDYDSWVLSATVPVVTLLPVVGVLAMASEWTQRTVLTTFTQSPRRIRVLSAKLAAAVILGLAVTAVVDVLAAGAMVARGLILDAPVTWGSVGSVVGGSAVSAALALVMGAALGALVMQTAVAIVTYFVAPNLVVIALSAAAPDAVQWVDVNQAFAWLSRFDLSGHVGQTVTPLLLWVALPLAVGLWRSVRRNVS